MDRYSPAVSVGSHRVQSRGALGVLTSLLLVGCEGSTPAQPLDAGTAITTPATCPSHLRFTFLAGNRTDVGWTGNLHGSTYARNSFFRARVVECDEECRSCAFQGPVRDDTVVTQRCLSDPAQVCSADEDCPPWDCRLLDFANPASPRVCAQDSTRGCQSDADCGPSACRFFVGPAFPILAPRTCLAVYLDGTDGQPPVSGVIDLFTGAVTFRRLRILSAVTGPQGACPKCVGDPVPNDGRREGTCVQSDVQPAFAYTQSQSCDANGVGQPALFDGNYSLDCTTPLGIRIELGLVGATTNGTFFELGATQPTFQGEPLWCGVCEGSLRPCHEAAECPPGVACVAPSDMPARANACLQACEWNEEAQRGTCLTQDPPGPTGDLPPQRRVACFPSGLGARLVAPGRSSVLSDTSYSIEVGHVACRAPVRAVVDSPVSVVADRQIGLPGPQYDVLRFQIDKEFEP